MKTWATIAILSSAVILQAEPLDRVAVSIGNYVITESAVVLDLEVGAFLDRKPPDLSAAAKRKSAERLTDIALILREANDSHLELPTVEQAKATFELLRRQYGSGDELQAEMRRYGVKEADIVTQLHTGLIAAAFSDLRFRPVVQVSDEELRALYAKLGGDKSFEESRPQLEDLLTQERVLEALDAWLAMARVEADVRFREKVFE